MTSRIGFKNFTTWRPLEEGINLSNLYRLATCIRTALDQNRIPLSSFNSLTHRYLRYASTRVECREKFIAYRICHEILRIQIPPFRVKIGTSFYQVPGHYKMTLSKKSPFFQALFFGKFKEGESTTICLKNISPKFFLAMLEILEKGDSPIFEGMELEELAEFMRQADQLLLEEPYEQAREILINTLKELDKTEDHLHVVISLRKTFFVEDKIVSDTIVEFLVKYVENLAHYQKIYLFFITSGHYLKHLQELKLGYFVDDLVLAFVTFVCPNLQKLEMSIAKEFTDKGAALFTRLRNLKFLTLSYHSGPEKFDLRCLAGLESLETLKFWSLSLEDNDLSTLVSCPRLQTLILRECDLTKGCIPHLLKMKHLQAVDLSYCPLLNSDDLQPLTTRGIKVEHKLYRPPNERSDQPLQLFYRRNNCQVFF